MNRWTNIRDRYVKYVKKIIEEKKTGSSAKPTRKYLFAEQLVFLQKVTRTDLFLEEEENVPSDQESASTSDWNAEEASLKANTSRSVESSQIAETNQYVETSQRSETGPQNDMNMARKRKILSKSIKKGISKKFSRTVEEPEDRNMSFFKGILPTLQLFADHETVQFQAGVLGLIQDIQRSRNLPNPHVSSLPYHHSNDEQAYPTEMCQKCESPGSCSSPSSTFVNIVTHSTFKEEPQDVAELQ